MQDAFKCFGKITGLWLSYTMSLNFQGVKFLRRFKQLLNPAQVFDLMNGGPHPG